MVNKALAVFQQASETGDTTGAGAATAEKVLNEALTFDPDSEAAVATLAQILLSSGNVDGAAKLFRKQAELARTVPDIQNALQFAFVSVYSPQLAGKTDMLTCVTHRQRRPRRHS